VPPQVLGIPQIPPGCYPGRVSGFLFAFLAVLVAGIGARDQVLVAHITRVQGPRVLLLAAALVSALAATALAGWAALRLLADIASPSRGLFAGLALVLAGGEMLFWSAPRAPAEPTRSLFAAFLVLLAQQVTDAARFLVLALGIAAAAPVPAALGGAVASVATLAFGWSAPQLATGQALRRVRRAAGIVLIFVGAWQFIA